MKKQIILTLFLILIIYIYSLTSKKEEIKGTEENIIKGKEVFLNKEKINIFKWIFNEEYRIGFIEGAIKNEEISRMDRNK